MKRYIRLLPIILLVLATVITTTPAFADTPTSQPFDNVVIVTSDGKHNAWGDTCYNNGRIHVVYGVSYNVPSGGFTLANRDIVYKSSDDYGANWNTEIILVSHNDISNLSSPELSLLSDGRIVLMFGGGITSGSNAVWYIMFTSDNGLTWTPPISVSCSLDQTYWWFTQNRIVELPSGEWLHEVYGKNPSDTYQSVYLVRSTDNGTTWGNQSLVADGNTDGINYDNSAMLYLGGNKLVTLIRYENNRPYMFQSVSDDSGLTWSIPMHSINGAGDPFMAKISDGRIIAGYRKYMPDTEADISRLTLWALSSDNMTTWQYQNIPVDDTAHRNNQGGFIEIAPNIIAIVYFAATTDTDCQVRFKYIGNDLLHPPDPSPDYVPPPLPTPYPNFYTQGGGGGGGGGDGSAIPNDHTGKTLVPAHFNYDLNRISLDIPVNTICLDRFGKPLHPQPSFKNLKEVSGNVTPIGIPFEFQPDGATFTPFITITVKLEKPTDNKTLQLATWNDTSQKWEYLDTVYNARDNSLSANITHFSTYAVLEHRQLIVKAQEMWDNILIPLVWRLDYDHANCPGNIGE